MKLQLLIPHYNELQAIIIPLLDSIAIQQSISFSDIGVIICHDGEDIPDFDFTNTKYPFSIKQIHIPHKGVSAARNGAFDASDAEYVMFCDIDDMFSSVCGIYTILNEINYGGFDALISTFIEESRAPEDIPEQVDLNGQIIAPALKKGQILYLNRENDSTFVHGKVYRRQYLLDNHIRWNDNLTIHEDSFFNILCQSFSTNIKYCPTPFYLWKWRDDSVCRRDPKYILKTYKNLIDSNNALIDEFLKRGCYNEALFYTGFLIFDAYYLMNKPEWREQENKEYRDSTEKYFAQYYKKRKELWEKIPDMDKMQMSNGIRSRTINEGMMMEAITIDEWLRHIETLID